MKLELSQADYERLTVTILDGLGIEPHPKAYFDTLDNVKDALEPIIAVFNADLADELENAKEEADNFLWEAKAQEYEHGHAVGYEKGFEEGTQQGWDDANEFRRHGDTSDV